MGSKGKGPCHLRWRLRSGYQTQTPTCQPAIPDAPVPCCMVHPLPEEQAAVRCCARDQCAAGQYAPSNCSTARRLRAYSRHASSCTAEGGIVAHGVSNGQHLPVEHAATTCALSMWLCSVNTLWWKMAVWKRGTDSTDSVGKERRGGGEACQILYHRDAMLVSKHAGTTTHAEVGKQLRRSITKPLASVPQHSPRRTGDPGWLQSCWS